MYAYYRTTIVKDSDGSGMLSMQIFETDTLIEMRKKVYHLNGYKYTDIYRVECNSDDMVIGKKMVEKGNIAVMIKNA